MEQTTVKKETSIEWLMTQLYKKGFIKEVDGSEPINLMNQAKAMEKEQIKMCCIKTMETCNSDMNELGCKTMDDYFNYIYNETFKSE